MKRIVIGKYHEPQSTRNIAEITICEFDAMLFSIKHLIKKYRIGLKLKKKYILAPVKEIASNPRTTESLRQTIQGITYQQLIEGMKYEIKLSQILLLQFEKIKSDFEKQKTKKRININGLDREQFVLLINTMLHTVGDLMQLVNSDASSLSNAVELGKKMGYIPADLDSKLIEQKIIKVKSKNQRYYEIAKTIYKILSEINTPYDGADYINEYGEQINTAEIFKKAPENLRSFKIPEEIYIN